MKIIANKLSIPLKFNFSHAAKTWACSATVLVQVERDGHTGYGEGCPREFVTGESVTGALVWINLLETSLAEITDVAGLKSWIDAHELEIDRHPAAWCAVETAILDLLGREQQRPLNELLGITGDPGDQKLTAVVGGGSIEFMGNLMDLYLSFEFSDFKIKLSGVMETDRAIMYFIRQKLPSDFSLRVDFNNVFAAARGEAFIRYVEALDYRFAAIEEPFEPRTYEVMAEIARRLDTPIILDESFTHRNQIAHLKQEKAFIPNLRISKLGGLLRTLKLMDELDDVVPRYVLGSHVGETSILGRLWLLASGYGGRRIMAREGAFSTHILDQDLTHPSIILNSQAGIDTPGDLDRTPGLGLNVLAERIHQYTAG